MLHVPQNNIKIYANGMLTYTGSLVNLLLTLLSSQADVLSVQGGKLKGDTTFTLNNLDKKISNVFPAAEDR